MSRDLLKRALDALELMRNFGIDCAEWDGVAIEGFDSVIRAIGFELAKPEQEPVAWGVFDPDAGSLEYAAGWPEACHEHINDCITEMDVYDATRWVVRPLYLAPVDCKCAALTRWYTKLPKAKS